MRVITVQVTLRLYAVTSLKAKRHAIAGPLQKVRQRFPVAAAEVGAQDDYRRTVLGLAAVGNEEAPLQEMLQKAVEFLERETGGEIWESRFDSYSGT